MAIDVVNQSLYIVVYPPNYKKGMTFTGYAKSLSSHDSEGAFDILPEHENFVAIVRDKITVVDRADKVYEFNIERALIEASNNLVKIFVEF